MASSLVGVMTTAWGAWVDMPAPDGALGREGMRRDGLQCDVINTPGGEDLVEDGEEEGGGLAGAGLGAGHQVPALADDGEPVLLHRGEDGVLGAAHVLQEDGGQAGAGEVPHRRGLVLPHDLAGVDQDMAKENRFTRNPGLLGQEPRSP